jgi:hypothetical protein
MKAITIHRPWAHCVAHLGKDIENRTWNCYLPPGYWIAIHAGKTVDFDAQTILSGKFSELPDASDQPTGIIAVARFRGNITHSESRWFVGPVGWELENIMLVDPVVPCRGYQKLWELPSEIEDQVLRRVKTSL